ncbi:TRAP transporter small permease subunit [Siculibacillus lacustris]|uniref:TRAP transporter small permease protein n=1 Tax=Siculibacillus lacustris TaxID=1549641 RepID=A0A4Q9VWQ7_9HYPH|nr:TRAP transporter small permease subunit [Siculibacillus lacustris]TBW40770.1 TRAP transporter small permease subunit [Siculibacillus lacustris]
MYGLADGIDGLNRWIGRTIAWGTIVMGVLQFTMVITRYVFGIGSVWIQESITYVFASLFMLGAASALLTDGHVRVDIWYREASPRGRAIVNLLGTLVFLWPVTGLILYESFPYVARSFAIREGSRETSGIPLLYLLKAEILIFAVLLALQGLSAVIRSIGVLTGRVPPAEDDAVPTLRVGH